ncbi:MAG: NAD(P)H-binding protein, partial [Vicinamibacteria bacterium]
NTTLVVGGTGKTGRRVAERLQERGVPVRIGSRAAAIPFDWERPETWGAAVAGAGAAYVAYSPDLAVPGATDRLRAFASAAVAAGVRRLVLLSGRGEEAALLGERVVRDSGAEWTILRAAWFDQNFSEGFFSGQVKSGTVALPAGGVREPFVDVDDIAEIAEQALVSDRHVGQVYELTGPRLLTFADAVAEIGRATGRPLVYESMPLDAYQALLAGYGVPADFVWLVGYLFTEVLDGRNASLADGVERALGRPARDFADYARTAAAAGAWS